MPKSYEVLNKLETFSNEEIIQFYHNSIMGHSFFKKPIMIMNENAKIAYVEELEKRNITKIPNKEGVFNGDGTY